MLFWLSLAGMRELAPAEDARRLRVLQICVRKRATRLFPSFRIRASLHRYWDPEEPGKAVLRLRFS